jgi:hypothetical protein
MVVDYTVEGDVFNAMKPRAWSDKQIWQPGTQVRLSGFLT